MALRIEAEKSRGAVVLGRWGEGRALVQLPGGAVVTASVPEHLRDAFDVGRRVAVTGDGGRVIACDPASQPPTGYGARRGFTPAQSMP